MAYAIPNSSRVPGESVLTCARVAVNILHQQQIGTQQSPSSDLFRRMKRKVAQVIFEPGLIPYQRMRRAIIRRICDQLDDITLRLTAKMRTNFSNSCA